VKTYCFIVLILVFQFLNPTYAVSATQDYVLQFRHAETFYWLGIEEHGDMESFEQALKYLEKAESTLKKSNARPHEMEAFASRIKIFRRDIEKQIDMAHDTFRGVFPMVGFLGMPLFLDPFTFHAYELIDDPDVVAVTNAAEKMTHTLAKRGSRTVQYDVVFVGTDKEYNLLNEVFAVVQQKDIFHVHPQSDVLGILNEQELKAFNEGKPSRETVQKLEINFSNNNLLVLSLDQIDQFDNVYHFGLLGKIYSASNDAQRIWFRGLCKDKREDFVILFGVHILLLLAAFAFYLFVGTRQQALSTYDTQSNSLNYWVNFMIIASGFIVGRLIPWFIAPLLIRPFMPEFENLAILSFWWPIMFGIALFIIPLLILKNIGSRAFQFLDKINPFIDSGALFIGVSAGLLAYLSVPMVLYLGHDSVIILVCLSIDILVSSYLLSLALNHKTSAGSYLLVFLIANSLAIGLIATSLDRLWSAFFAFFAISAFIICRPDSIESQDNAETHPDSNSSIPLTLKDLAEATESPRFQETLSFAQLFERVSDGIIKEDLYHVILCGEGGSGKSAAARELINRLRTDVVANSAYKRLTVLRGQCEQISQDEKGEPYAVFRDVFSPLLGISRSGKSAHSSNPLDSAVGALIENFVPFQSILFPPIEHESEMPISEEGMLISIVKSLTTIHSDNLVIVLIEDLQWIDEGSRKLLVRLIDKVKSTEGGNLLLIITTRNIDDPKEIGLENNSYELTDPDDILKGKILVKSLGLKDRVAHKIIEDTKSPQGGLFWMLQTVFNLASKDYLRREENGFDWAPGFSDKETIPVPADFISSVRESLNQHKEYLSIVTCAACMGQQFNVNFLARVLKTDRLTVLSKLKELEENTGFVYDLKDKNDIFAFRSNFILESVRQILGIKFEGPESANVAQLVREYHARLAEAIEQDYSETNTQNLFLLARHYYAAGSSRAKNALHYALKAAHAAKNLYQHEEAMEYVGMARDCARILNQVDSFEVELLLLQCQISHIHRPFATDATRAGLNFLERMGDEEIPIPLRISIARSCFDSGNYESCLTISKMILQESEPADNPVVVAEAKQFIGISLLELDSSENVEESDRLISEALEILKSCPQTDIQAQALQARASDSYGNLLLRRQEWEKAHEMFALSAAIKNSPQIQDILGLSRSLRGLGDVAFALDDIKKAVNNYTHSLELDQQTHDEFGQSLKHSKLGGCYLKVGDYESAISHYEESYQHAITGVTGKIFADIGLLHGYLGLSQVEDIKRVLNDLLDLMNSLEKKSGPWSSALEAAVDQCKERYELNELYRLKDLLSGDVDE